MKNIQSAINFGIGFYFLGNLLYGQLLKSSIMQLSGNSIILTVVVIVIFISATVTLFLPQPKPRPNPNLKWTRISGYFLLLLPMFFVAQIAIGFYEGEISNWLFIFPISCWAISGLLLTTSGAHMLKAAKKN